MKAWEVIGLIKTNQSTGVTTHLLLLQKKICTSGASAWDLAAEKRNNGGDTWLRFTVTRRKYYSMGTKNRINRNESL